MSANAIRFADILSPVTPEEFFAEYHDTKPLLVRGTREKVAGIMAWDQLNALLDMTAIWSSASLQLFLDNDMLAPARYCRPAIDRSGNQALQPDAQQVLSLLRQGASLVANDIDTLTPGLRAVARALEEATGGKAQANLYCSWRQRQAFAVHFDTHDVHAIHFEGEKVWRIYEGRHDNPIAHPRFKTFGQDYHDKAKGKLLMEVTLKPGDFLYLPRGQYHEALASASASLHVTFGVTAVIGLDFIHSLFERAVDDSLFRANAPRLDSRDNGEVEAHLAKLMERLAEIAADPEAIAQFKAFQRGFRYPRDDYGLPGSVTSPRRYRVKARGVKLVRHGQAWALQGSKGTVAVPEEMREMVAWILPQQGFSRSELSAAFAGRPAGVLDRLLADLAAMKLVEPV
ncbi:MAG: hypothetical protein IIA73_10070 [Proteobacteria bacterium]|nr:hypothetical protein [Pseudomonadota bacterium]